MQTPCILGGICLPAEDSEVNGMSHPGAVDRIYKEGSLVVHCYVKRTVILTSQGPYFEETNALGIKNRQKSLSKDRNIYQPCRE